MVFAVFYKLGMENFTEVITVLSECALAGIILTLGIAFLNRFPLYGFFGNPFRKFDYMMSALCFLVSINTLGLLVFFYFWVP